MCLVGNRRQNNTLSGLCAVMVRTVGLVLVNFLLVSHAFAGGVKLEGHASQGGLMWGQVGAGSRVSLSDEQLPVHENGVFVFGFGRDETGERTLEVIHADGTVEHLAIVIAKRDFDIERVNGLPPKTVSPPPAWAARRKTETMRVGKARSVLMPETFWIEGFARPAEGRFSGFYGSQRILNGEPRSPHYGLDIAADVGTPIVAPAAGIVRLAAPDFLLEGGIVIIDHGLGVTSTLFHMSKVDVKEGQRVAQGEKIGAIGATGRASGPHVDWRVNWQNVRLDPYLLLSEDDKK